MIINKQPQNLEYNKRQELINQKKLNLRIFVFLHICQSIKDMYF